jgi:tRNA 2-selenouridine synthase
MINGFSRDDIKSHEEWISRLLTGYYDPMYKYKLELRKDYIIHIGDYKTCMDYLRSCK